MAPTVLAPEAPRATRKGSVPDPLAEMRHGLLDLNGRNRLLHCRFSFRSLRFVEGEMAAMYDALAKAAAGGEARAIPLRALPEPAPEAWVTRMNKRVRPEADEWARKHKISTSYFLPPCTGQEFRALLYEDELAVRCRALRRESERVAGSRGSHRLYLILGLLDYPKAPRSEESWLAPLVCVPVKLQPAGEGGRQFTLTAAAGGLADNLAVREKLRRDFKLELPELPGRGGDLEKYFAAVAALGKEQPTVRLRREAAVALLDFGPLRVYSDLDPDEWEGGLGSKRLIQTLWGAAAKDAAAAPEAHNLENAPGSELPLVCDADASQHAALVDAACQEKDLVIEGAPGTGKSQTITNLIAATVAAGRSVLLVAEKQAALEAVAARLRVAGLGPLVLELYGEHASAAAVRASLRERLEWKPQGDPKAAEQLELAQRKRDQLREYAEAVQATWCSKLGVSVHEAIWSAERSRLKLGKLAEEVEKLEFAAAAEMEGAQLREAEACMSELAKDFAEYGHYGATQTLVGFSPKAGAGDGKAIAATLLAAKPGLSDFAAAAAAYAALCPSAPGLTATTAASAAAALRDLKSKLDPALPLALMPALLAASEAVEPGLEALAQAIASSKELETSVRKGMKPDAPEGIEDDLSELEAGAAKLGVELGTVAEILKWQENLARRVEWWTASMGALGSACKPLGWSIGDLGNIEQVLKLGEAGAAAPTDGFIYQDAELFDPACGDALGELKQSLLERDALAKELSTELDLDAIPGAEEMEEACAWLQQSGISGALSRDYRAAGKLFDSLLRGEKRFARKQRLELMEKGARWARLKRAISESLVRKQYLPGHDDADLAAIEQVRVLAVWNQQMASLMGEAGLRWNFATAEGASTLAMACGRVRAITSDARDALADLRKLLPGLAIAKPVTVVSRQVEGLAAAAAKSAEWLRQWATPQARLKDIAAASRAKAELRAKLDAVPRLEFLGSAYRGMATDIAAIRRAHVVARTIAAAPLPGEVREAVLEDPARAGEIGRVLEGVAAGFQNLGRLQKELDRFGELDLEAWAGCAPAAGVAAFAAGFLHRLDEACHGAEAMAALQQRELLHVRGQRLGLTPWRQAFEEKLDGKHWPEAFRYLVYRSVVQRALRELPGLEHLAGERHERLIAEFQAADREAVAGRGPALAARLAEAAGGSAAAVRKLVEKEAGVGELLAKAWEAVRELKPAFLLAPQGVGSYLPRTECFDLLVVDEASQVRPLEMAGALARARQVVVVGDGAQLPPLGDGSADTGENLLRRACARLPIRTLARQYRARHESLAAFVNQHLYAGQLKVAPSPADAEAPGARAEYLPKAIYSEQRNPLEAARVVELLSAQAGTESTLSVGVVALTPAQRDLIADLLEHRMTAEPALAAWMQQQQAAGHPLFIHALEDVQGEERELILVSTVYGKSGTSAGVRQNFGLLGRPEGGAALNVMLTRARHELVVVTSLQPDDIVRDEATPRGVALLRDFLEHLRSGRKPAGGGEKAPDAFEAVLQEVLRPKGYTLVRRGGELLAEHTEAAGCPLAMVAGDGPAYQAAGSVRDRDRVQPTWMAERGWEGRQWRVWSVDWYRDPAAEAKRLVAFLERQRKSVKAEAARPWIEVTKVVAVNYPGGGMPAADPDGDPIVRVNDNVLYCQTQLPDKELTAAIGDGTSETAQALLGAVAGDEVIVRIAGRAAQTLRVLQVLRPVVPSA